MRIALAAALLLAASCAPRATEPETPPVELRGSSDGAELIVRLDSDRIPITDPLRVRLEAIVDESQRVDFPDRIGSPEDFAQGASDVSAPRLLDGGRVAYERTYELEPFLPGQYDLGRIVVEHWPKEGASERKEAAVEGASVTVDSVLDPEGAEEAELRDIRGPVEPPLPWALIAAVGFGALALAALAVWLWKRRRPAAPVEEAAPLPPPHAAALEALDRLLSEGLPERGEHKLFFGLLSNILRRYVEDRFGIHAPERTTQEFLHELKGGRTLGPAHQGLLKMFLEYSDMVKFAEMTPAREDIARSVSLCRRFIEETAPRGLEQVEETNA